MSQRPYSINELAQMALENIYDEKKDLKYHLRMAEKYRKEGKQFANDGHLENAFMAYARAATLVLERLPYHRDYKKVLTPTQRHNMSLNGNEMLERLTELKLVLLERYSQWKKDHPNDGDETDALNRPSRQGDKRGKEPQRDVRGGQHRERKGHRAGGSEDHRRIIEEERRAWEEERDEHEEGGDLQHPPFRTPRHSPDPSHSSSRPPDLQRQPLAPTSASTEAAGKRDAAVAAARLAAAGASTTPIQGPNGSATDLLDPAEQMRRFQKQQEEMRQREEEILRRRERAKAEQEAIAMRQQEADEEARMIRQTIAHNNPGVTVTAPPGPSLPFTRSPSVHRPSPSSHPTMDTTPIRSSSHFLQATPAIMPLSLESPSKYEDSSTDSEPMRDWRATHRKRTHTVEYPKPLNRAPTTKSPAYPPPVTTTSPPPPEARAIHYPDLMSQHQRHQGYQPSLNSMFANGLMFHDTRNGYHGPSPLQNQVPQYPSYPGPSRPAPAPPEIAPTNHQHHPIEQQHQAAPPPSGPPSSRLRAVNLPRDCLTKFLTLAKANTLLNLETCGLLLGKPKGPTKFAVTTLLIPKQHSTSDTCTMDEEELVLEFTEARGLITLGWIHTHPTQSCFMSSLDLHTHSGFQCMLPESFAIVCAPKSTPNFGIFRLTDPPGLNIILECKAKQAFHPHPDKPIYTDADRGHVHMKDGSVEIVDLR